MTDIYRILKINDRKWVVQKLVVNHSIVDRIKWVFGESPFVGWIPVGRPQISYDQANGLMERICNG